jgi:hypothetical protein
MAATRFDPAGRHPAGKMPAVQHGRYLLPYSARRPREQRADRLFSTV